MHTDEYDVDRPKRQIKKKLHIAACIMAVVACCVATRGTADANVRQPLDVCTQPSQTGMEFQNSARLRVSVRFSCGKSVITIFKVTNVSKKVVRARFLRVHSVRDVVINITNVMLDDWSLYGSQTCSGARPAGDGGLLRACDLGRTQGVIAPGKSVTILVAFTPIKSMQGIRLGIVLMNGPYRLLQAGTDPFSVILPGDDIVTPASLVNRGGRQAAPNPVL